MFLSELDGDEWLRAMSAKLQAGKKLSRLDIVKLEIAPQTGASKSNPARLKDCIDIAKRGITDYDSRARAIARLLVAGNKLADEAFVNKAVEGIQMGDLYDEIRSLFPDYMIPQVFGKDFAVVKAKAKARGIARGIAEVLAEAMAEARADMMASASALLASGVPPETVARCLNISKMEISAILRAQPPKKGPDSSPA